MTRSETEECAFLTVSQEFRDRFSGPRFVAFFLERCGELKRPCVIGVGPDHTGPAAVRCYSQVIAAREITCPALQLATVVLSLRRPLLRLGVWMVRLFARAAANPMRHLDRFGWTPVPPAQE